MTPKAPVAGGAARDEAAEAAIEVLITLHLLVGRESVYRNIDVCSSVGSVLGECVICMLGECVGCVVGCWV